MVKKQLLMLHCVLQILPARVVYLFSVYLRSAEMKTREF